MEGSNKGHYGEIFTGSTGFLQIFIMALAVSSENLL